MRGTSVIGSCGASSESAIDFGVKRAGLASLLFAVTRARESRAAVHDRSDSAVLQASDVQHGLPFAVNIPNAETHEALRQAHEGESLNEYNSLDDLKAALG